MSVLDIDKLGGETHQGRCGSWKQWNQWGQNCSWTSPPPTEDRQPTHSFTAAIILTHLKLRHRAAWASGCISISVSQPFVLSVNRGAARDLSHVHANLVAASSARAGETQERWETDGIACTVWSCTVRGTGIQPAVRPPLAVKRAFKVKLTSLRNCRCKFGTF